MCANVQKSIKLQRTHGILQNVDEREKSHVCREFELVERITLCAMRWVAFAISLFRDDFAAFEFKSRSFCMVIIEFWDADFPLVWLADTRSERKGESWYGNSKIGIYLEIHSVEILQFNQSQLYFLQKMQ